MYEEMRRKQARQKMLRNFVESLILLLCLGVVVGCCSTKKFIFLCACMRTKEFLMLYCSIEQEHGRGDKSISYY